MRNETKISMQNIRDALYSLHKLLLSENDIYSAQKTEEALTGSEDDLKAYIISNDLWGGAGSIADQALLKEQQSRQKFETIMAELGQLQIRQGIINERTEMWTKAFNKWKNDDDL